jgi:LmbE family N-acetylglucosaminyl deacetylase
MIEWWPATGALRVVALGAHPDDIEIGCGGTLLRLAQRDATQVHGLVLTGTGERAAEARSALSRFVPGATVHVAGLPDGRLPASWHAVKQTLEDTAAEMAADLVLAPRPDDAHQDHRLVGELAPTVWRDALVLHYEIPKWDGDLSAPAVFVGLSPEVARRKVALLNDAFPSQKSRDWWDDEMFLGLMRIRGMECRHRYAEAFHTKKIVLTLDDEPRDGEEG